MRNNFVQEKDVFFRSRPNIRQVLNLMHAVEVWMNIPVS